MARWWLQVVVGLLLVGLGTRLAPSSPEPARVDGYGDALPTGAVARLGTLRFRHDGGARTLAFSPDGKTLAATSAAGQVFFWDAATGRVRRRLRLGNEPKMFPFALAFAPDGQTLAVGLVGRIYLVEVATGRERLQVPVDIFGYEGEGALGFSPDGKTLAAAGNSRSAHLFDVATGKERLQVQNPNTDALYRVVISPDGTLLATGASNPAVRLWDLATGKLVRDLGSGRRRSAASAVVFSPDGKTLAWGNWDEIVLAEVATGRELGKLQVGKMETVTGLAFTPDARTLISASQDGKVCFWDVPRLEERLRLDARMAPVEGLALSRDGGTVAVSSYFNVVRLWDVASGKERCGDLHGHGGSIADIAYAPDGKIIAVASDSGEVVLWDATTARERRELSVARPHVVAFAPDGRQLATAGSANSFQVWDAATGTLQLTLGRTEKPGVSDPARRVAFSPDGKRLLSAHATALVLWDSVTGKLLRDFSLQPLLPEAMAVAADNRTVALGTGDGTIRLWDVEAGKEVLILTGHEHSVESVAFSPDGQLLVSGSLDQTVRVWEVLTGKEVQRLRGDGRAVSAVAFRPDGRVVAAAGGSGRYPLRVEGPFRIQFWDVGTGWEVFHLEGHDCNVNALAFAPDGSRLASGLQNATALVWDLAPLAPALERVEKALAGGDVAALWADLASQDAARAQYAVAALAVQPGKSVPFLREHLRPAAAADPKQLRQLLADLDSDQYAVRGAAAKELEEVSDQAEPVLRQTLAANPSPEVRKRLEALLEGARRAKSPERLRGVRGVQALERVGSPAAREVLEALSRGAPGARLTQDACDASKRLGK